MDLLYSFSDGASVRGLIVYGVGVALIFGALAWATRVDYQRDKRRQAARSDS